MNTLLIIGNIVFIPIDSDNRNIEQKYIKASIGGSIYTNDIYSLTEVRKEWPDVKACKDFLSIKEVWGSH